jgi:hypothetical protein
MSIPREPYSCLYRGIFQHDKLRRRSDVGKLVYFYALSSSYGNGLGCFRAGRAAMAEEMGVSIDRFDAGLADCCNASVGDPLLLYDDTERVLYVPHYIARNPPYNPNALRAMARDYKTIPDCRAKLLCYEALAGIVAARSAEFQRAFRDYYVAPIVRGNDDDAATLNLPLGRNQRSTLAGDPRNVDYWNSTRNVDSTLISGITPTTLIEDPGNVDNVASTLPATLSGFSVNVAHSGYLRPKSGDLRPDPRRALLSDARAPEFEEQGEGRRWDPPDPRGFEATWRWREDLPDAVHEQIAHVEMPARGWAARILWYWPALTAQEAGEIAVQTLRNYATQGVDIRAELAKAAGARGRADGTHGLRRFLASWMGRAQVDVARLRSRPGAVLEGPTRPIPPPAAEVVPPDPERTPEEEAECRRLAAEFARQIQGIPAQGPEPAHVEEVRAAVLGDDEMSPAQRAEFEAMAARARRKARALEGPDLATAGALAAEFLTGGER